MEGDDPAGNIAFRHGTGVCEAGYTKSLRLIQRQANAHGLDLDVGGCFWGESQGARLRCEGRSIPGYAESGGGAPSAADELIALWSLLYTDPWYELRVLRAMPASPVPLGQEPPAVLLSQMVAEFVPSEELGARLREAGLAGHFAEAVDALRAAPEFEAAAATAPADPLEHRAAVARALVAYTLVAAEDAGGPPPDGTTRDAIVLRLTDELRGHALGVGGFVRRTMAGLAARGVTRKLRGDRGALTDAAAPASGDVLRFLANGDGVRGFVRGAVADVSGRGRCTCWPTLLAAY